jgi:4-hydroxybenzoate polyprenyltransferase
MAMSRAWFVAAHPGPSLLVAALTALFAWSVGLAWWQVMVVFGAMVCNQIGIGLGNDWVDARLDRESGRTDKPVAVGILRPNHVGIAAIGFGAIALGLSAPLGWWAVACQSVMLAAGWWYNIHAKSRWFSPFSYLVGFGLLPVFPSLALEPPGLPAWWVVAVAALLGFSAHFANVLPDIAADRQINIRGLPQIMGPRLSGVVMMVGVVAVTVLIAAYATSVPMWLRFLAASLAVGATVYAMWLSFLPSPPRMIFPVVMGSAAVSVAAIAWEFASR